MINRQNQPWAPTPKPDIEWVTGTPRSRQFEDIYFDTRDGLEESRYVFLEGVELGQYIANTGAHERLNIAETGFGTGLNFLLTLRQWQQHRQPDAQLHYVGIDAMPLARADLEKALQNWPSLAPLAAQLGHRWPHAVPGCHRLCWPECGVTLDLWWEPAEQALNDLASRNRKLIDLWYLDGFAPARNNDMWSAALFQAMAQLSKPGARFTTFTAASRVRSRLQEAGFEVHKRPGFGHKRECLYGRFDAMAETPLARDDDSTVAVATPKPNRWDLNPRCYRPEHVVILGAGLAGAHIARSLAERGVNVTVLERGDIAGGGSSNLQGLTYTRISRRFAPLSDFAVTSYGFAVRHYHQLFKAQQLGPDDGEICGYLQISEDDKTLDYLAGVLADGSNLAQVVSPEVGSRILGLAVRQRGLFYPDALWLNPPAICQERLSHPRITVQSHCGHVDVSTIDGGWLAQSEHRGSYEASTLILATAHSLGDTPYTDWLPLQGIRGQTTHVPATVHSRTLNTAFCHEGYLPPARHGVHCLGASYGPNDLTLDERASDHRHNLERLHAVLPDTGFPRQASGLTGHVALRCTSSDYLPVAGPVPHRARFNAKYHDLSKQKTRVIDTDCPVHDGLWVMGALGSRGLTAAPLCAELLASELLGEPCPVPRYLQQALAPARFLARGLIRGQPL